MTYDPWDFETGLKQITAMLLFLPGLPPSLILSPVISVSGSSANDLVALQWAQSFPSPGPIQSSSLGHNSNSSALMSTQETTIEGSCKCKAFLLAGKMKSFGSWEWELGHISSFLHV